MLCPFPRFFQFVAKAALSTALLAAFSAAAIAASPSASPAVSPAGASESGRPIKAIDLDGNVQIVGSPESVATAVVFLGVGCPIANAAMPTISALVESHRADGVAVYGVVSDPTITRKEARERYAPFAAKFPILFDASGELAERFKPTITPQAFVMGGGRRASEIVYSGRIDDRYITISRASEVTKHHELADAVADVVAGRAVRVASAPAVGCAFEAWNVGGVDRSKLSSKPTFARDVAPILFASCVDCHHDGAVAPFSLTSYADAAKRAKQIASVTDSRYMPPWKPYHAASADFLGERRLTAAQIKIISDWANGGAVEGDAANLPPVPQFSAGWTLGKPDLELKMPEAFDIPAGGRDIYRAFVIPIDVPQDCYVAGVEFRPGAATVVHHSLFYLDTSGQARKLDAADPGPGYKSFGGPGFAASGSLGGWAPGAMPHLLPDGVGKPLKKGSDLVLAMHYHPDGQPHQDQSAIAIYFQKKPITAIEASYALTTRDINIPAGEAHYERHATITLPVDVTITGITPHMHLLGREMTVAATLPDGTTKSLISVKDWDFRWQDQYRFATPITLPKGTRVDMSAVYDNSANNASNPNDPPQRVRHGEQTTDEMCLCFVQYQTSRVADVQAIRGAMRQSIQEGSPIGKLLRSMRGTGADPKPKEGDAPQAPAR